MQVLTHSDPWAELVGKSAGSTRLVLPAAGGNLRHHLQREDPPVAEAGSLHKAGGSSVACPTSGSLPCRHAAASPVGGRDQF